MRPVCAPSRDFSPATPGKRGQAGQGADGSSSNTSQKGAGALIDFLTVVFPAARLEEFGVSALPQLLGWLFGFRGEVIAGPIRERMWQFYRLSSVLVDRNGEVVGRVGLDGNKDTVCVSLSGGGTRWVRRSWDRVAHAIDELHGRISRCDVAFDDYEGKTVNVHALREAANRGEFAESGRPPKHRFLSDEGHGTGSTLYVGGKGHKELCVYEKGKQQGLPDSPWTRLEVRFYGKHAEGRCVPLDVLRDPVAYLRGSYRVVAGLITGACSVIKTEAAKAKASAVAMITWLKRQCGQSIGLILHALGGDVDTFASAISAHVARAGIPGRFRGLMQESQVHKELQACLAS